MLFCASVDNPPSNCGRRSALSVRRCIRESKAVPTRTIAINTLRGRLRLHLARRKRLRKNPRTTAAVTAACDASHLRFSLSASHLKPRGLFRADYLFHARDTPLSCARIRAAIPLGIGSDSLAPLLTDEFVSRCPAGLHHSPANRIGRRRICERDSSRRVSCFQIARFASTQVQFAALGLGLHSDAVNFKASLFARSQSAKFCSSSTRPLSHRMVFFFLVNYLGEDSASASPKYCPDNNEL